MKDVPPIDSHCTYTILTLTEKSLYLLLSMCVSLSLVHRALYSKDEYGKIVFCDQIPSDIRIIAVEPVDGMRVKCKEQLQSYGHRVTVLDEFQDVHHDWLSSAEDRGVFPVFNLNGSGSQIPVSSASVDLVVIAQAFHWFSSRETLAEIARVSIVCL